jgi:2-polyprenyl-3-methyl-5-hydroxy-6-metoxy-1,4-benzoquinol methylase
MKAMEWTPERIQRFWHYQAQFPDDYFTKRFGARIARTLAPWLEGSRSVLDYGCGPGFLVRHLDALGFVVTATDASPEAVRKANANNRDVACFQGARPLGEILAADLRFDALVSVEAIEHMDDAALGDFFASARRLLRPEGRLVITTPNEEDLAKAEIYCPACDHTVHRWQHLRSWSETTLGAAVRAHGFSVRSVFTTDFAAPAIPGWRTVAKRALGRIEKQPHLVCVAAVGRASPNSLA